jgi:mannose-1-phosphate guanylyltransferase
VETDASGRIGRFVEKPEGQAAGGSASNEQLPAYWINAGTYILEPELLDLVPAGEFAMFERGLFPELLRRNTPMYGYRSAAYWIDIGTPQTYLQVHRDLLAGRAQFTPSGHRSAEEVWLEGQAEIDPQARLRGPLVIGHGAHIGPGAEIHGPAVIGPSCRIGANVIVDGAVLWSNITLEENAIARSCVVGSNCRIGARTRVDEGALLGDGCVLGADNLLARGIRLWPGIILGDQAISF